MKSSVFVVIALCATASSGCVLHDHHRHRPRAAKMVVPVPAIVVPVPVPAPAKHCPPGQAKKGKC